MMHSPQWRLWRWTAGHVSLKSVGRGKGGTMVIQWRNKDEVAPTMKLLQTD